MAILVMLAKILLGWWCCLAGHFIPFNIDQQDNGCHIRQTCGQVPLLMTGLANIIGIYIHMLVSL